MMSESGRLPTVTYRTNPPTVVLFGAGGLGGPIAAGMARIPQPMAIRIVDGDTVDLSNLPRQVQFRRTDIGASKAKKLAEALSARGIPTQAVHEFAKPETLFELVDSASVVIDGTDNVDNKFAVADYCTQRGIPHVIAGAIGKQGNVFAHPGRGHACYRCIFEEAPLDTATCASAGVLGPVCGIVGTLAARVLARMIEAPTMQESLIYSLSDGTNLKTLRTVRLSVRSNCLCQSAPRLKRTSLGMFSA